MMNRRYRKCKCMYNMNNYSQDVFEDKCANVCSCKCNDYEKDECECGFEEEVVYDVFPTNPMLAQSYVPIQFMDKTFKPCIGLKQGTIFPELVSPYSPGQSMEEIAFIERTNKIGEGCNR
jgi:hypothetical protein